MNLLKSRKPNNYLGWLIALNKIFVINNYKIDEKVISYRSDYVLFDNSFFTGSGSELFQRT